MQRLLGLLGLTSLVVLTACFYTSNGFAVFLLIVCVALFALSLLFAKLRKEKTIPVGLITAIIAISVFLSYTHIYAEPLQRMYDNKKVSVTATQLSSEDYVNGFYTYKLKVTSVNGDNADFKMMLRSKVPFNSEPYDELSFPCELRVTSKNSDASKGIFLQTYLFDQVEFSVKEPERRPFTYHLINLRERLSTDLYMEMDYDTASFSSAVLLGDKYAVSPYLQGLLRTTGLSHIAVVSGLHLSIVTLICRKIFSKLFRNIIASGCLTIASVLVFAGLTGFGISVIRAAVMLIIYIVGTMVGRKGDSLNSIGCAALLLLCINPYAVGDVGMLLSFAATIGIVLWSKKLSVPAMDKLNTIPFFKLKAVNWLASLVVETLSCSICATLWTLPITILVYRGFSLVSLIANLLVVPLMTVVLFCIGACIAIHYIEFLSVLGDALSFVVALFYDYLLCVCGFLSELPFAYIYTTESYFYVWLAVSICLVTVALVMRRRFVNVLCILLSLLTVFSCSAVYRIFNKNSVFVHITDTGYGQSVVLESTDGYAVLSAAGTRSKSYLLNNKVRTLSAWGNDVLVDTGGYNSAEYCRNLVNEFDYEHILRYHNTNKSVDTLPYSEDETVFSRQYALDLWQKVHVELVPVGNIIIEYVHIGGSTLLLLPRGTDCEQIPKEFISADYLIADGKIKSAHLLEFDTLVVSDDEKSADESILPLFAKAKSVQTGLDIVLKIKIT